MGLKARIFELFEAWNARALNAGGVSSWRNLGFWCKYGLSYSEAAEEMVRRHAQRLNLCEQDCLLDLGYGDGSQLVFWKRAYLVHKIWGVELRPRDLHGDAEVTVMTWEQLGQRPAVRPNKIVAVDSFYFFSQREEKLVALARRLPKGGQICWSDFYLEKDAVGFGDRWALHVISWLTGVPYANWQSLEQFKQLLNVTGFSRVETSVISDEVMGGFVAYVGRQASRPLIQRSGLILSVATAALFRFLRRRRLLGYVLISAQKSASNP